MSSADPRNPQLERGADAFTALAMAALLIAGLAGCASIPPQPPNHSQANAAPYVGMFTGAFVDGKPLYRFPAINVVGSRIGIGPGI